MCRTVVVKQFPIMFSPSSDDAFLIQMQSDFFPSLDLLETQIDYTFDIDSLQGSQRKSFESLAIALARVGIAFDRRWEAWALGPTSTLVAQFLNQISSTSAQIMDAEHKASLILIDRTMDLATPATLGFDCLADRYLNLTNSSPQQCGLIFPKVHLPMEKPVVGFSSNLAEQSALLNILCLPPKECLSELRKRLVDFMHEIGAELPNLSTIRSPSAAIAALLETIVAHDAGGGPSLIYKNAELAIAAQIACQLTDENVFEQGEFSGLSLASYALTKHLLATSDIQNVVDHLNALADLKQPLDMRFPVATIILALAVIEEAVSDTEFDQVQKSLVKLLLSRRLAQRPAWLDAAVFEMLQEHHSTERPSFASATKQLKLAVEDSLESMLENLKRIQAARSRLQDYPRVVPQPGKLISIVKQVATHVFEKKDVPLQDLTQISFSVRGLLKTGLGLGLGRLGFGGTSLPRPTDRATVVFFVIGGITFSEIRELREIASQHVSNFDIMFGSTRILSTSDLHGLMMQK